VLANEAARFDGQVAYLFRPRLTRPDKNAVTNFLARAHDAPRTPPLKMARLRITWLLGLIDTYVPVDSLLEASGVQTLHGLSRVMPYARGTDPAQAREMLRGDPW